MKKEESGKREQKLNILREATSHKERIGEASYFCLTVSMDCTGSTGHARVLGHPSISGLLPEERLSQYTQLLLPALTCLPHL